MKRVSLLLTLMLLMTALSAQSISETLAQIQAAKTEYEQNLKIVEQKIAELRSSNPLFAPQDAFESDFEYLARLSQASPQIERIRKQYLDDVWLKLNKLRSRTWETTNISVTFGKYEPNSQVWDLVIQHNEHQKERFELKKKVERATAKTINDNQNRLIIKGVLTIDVADKIGLAKLLVRDPVTSFEIATDFHPIVKYDSTIRAFSSDGKLIAAVNGSKASIFNLETLQQMLENEFDDYYSNSFNSLSFSPDGKFLATGSDDGSACIFNLETHQQIAEFENDGYYGSVNSVTFSPDGKFLATGSDDGKARIFNLETRQQIVEFEHGNDYYNTSVHSVAFSPDGKFLATGCPDGACILSLETRRQIMDFGHESYVYSVAFSPDGKFLATGSDDDRARIFNLSSNKKTASHDFGQYIAWSPVGTYLATSGGGKTQIINTSTGKQHYLYDAEGFPAFSPDGRFLAIGDAIYRTFISLEGAEPEKAISLPPQLAVQMEFIEPSGNKFLDALEKATLKLRFSNSGQGSAMGITAKLEPAKINGLNYLNGFVAEVPAGKTVELDIPIEAYIDVADGTHQLNISFEEANGFPPAPKSLTFSTRAYKKPEFLISEIGIDDTNKNGKIEAGEMIELTVRFKNNGSGAANGSYAKFYAGDDVFITDKYAKTQSLGELKPGQSKDLKLEFFINERCVNAIPLYVDITEATGLAGVNKLRVPITKSDATRHISSLVITGKDEIYTPDSPAALNIDVEQNIPTGKATRSSDYAVIFGVELYPGSVPRAIYASRDATWFREYALKTLGIPEQNIYFKVNDAVTKNEFDKVFGRSGWLDLRVKSDSQVYFYFSGHGIPSDVDSKAYILPYDADPNYAALTAYPLQSVYDGLNGLKSARNYVFLDACFTGQARENQALYASARPIYYAPEKPAVPAKVTVMSASESRQMSNAWPEKQHGLFTYFLLKGMQGSADANQDGKLSLAELYDYVKKEVPVQAARLDKEQMPQLDGSQTGVVLVEY